MRLMEGAFLCSFGHIKKPLSLNRGNVFLFDTRILVSYTQRVTNYVYIILWRDNIFVLLNVHLDNF